VQPQAPPKARTGLFIGLGAGGLVVVGLAVFLVMQSMEESRRTADATRRAAERVAEETKRASDAARERE
jgi:hypothetical protein